MTYKTANVVARVEPQVKQEAEEILGQIGLSASTLINALYKQIIIQRAVPFQMVAYNRPKSLDEMSGQEIDAMLAEGLRQAKSGQGGTAESMFAEIRRRHKLR